MMTVGKKILLGLSLFFIPLLNSLIYFLASSVNYEKVLGLMIATMTAGLLTVVVALIVRNFFSQSSSKMWISIGATYFILIIAMVIYAFSYATPDEQKFILVIIAFGSLLIAPTVFGMNYVLHRVLDKK